MVARIYKPAKTAMQSGEGRTKEWMLEFAPASPREIEPIYLRPPDAQINWAVRGARP